MHTFIHIHVHDIVRKDFMHFYIGIEELTVNNLCIYKLIDETILMAE